MERLDQFMARANAAYYARAGFARDFTTSPEISQVFGEILGLWAAVVWQSMGAPGAFILVEAGPGRGTLMADALRAAARVPGFMAAAQLHLVETSPGLRALQAKKLPGARWCERVEELPSGPMILLANEFFDALPIRQHVFRGSGWVERFVADGQFVEQAASPPDHPAAAAAPEGTVLETCPNAIAIAAHLGVRFAKHGGAALLLDYGPAERAAGDSLQAIRAGRPADPLGTPGDADLTAHVDFAAIAQAASPAVAFGPVPQGSFLVALGLFQRSFALARTLPPREGAAMVRAAQRLAEPDAMGRLFKAMAVCDPGLPTPPGFEA